MEYEVYEQYREVGKRVYTVIVKKLSGEKISGFFS